MLDTLDAIKLRLGIAGTGDDALLGRLQTTSEAFIAQRTLRDFPAGAFTEDFPGTLSVLPLKNYPVEGVQVFVDALAAFGPETELPTAYYRVDKPRGIVRSLLGPYANIVWPLRPVLSIPRWQQFPGAIRVVYTTNAAVPEIVREALALLVGFAYRQVKTAQASGQRNLIKDKVGDSFVIFETGQDEWYESALKLLDMLRTPAV